MATIRIVAACGAGILLAAAGFMIRAAQDPVETPADAVPAAAAADQLPVSDPSCTYFGPDREKFIGRQPGLERATADRRVSAQLAPAADVMAAFDMATPTSAPRRCPRRRAAAGPILCSTPRNNIDKYLFQAMADAGVAPAPPTTDFEFVRRVDARSDRTHPHARRGDLVCQRHHVGQAPEAGRFAARRRPSGWTNGPSGSATSSRTIPRTPRSGAISRAWWRSTTIIRNSLTSGKPYDQMAREIISATGPRQLYAGRAEFHGRRVHGRRAGSGQFDLQAANTAETFLGVSHLNCLLCHSGTRPSGFAEPVGLLHHAPAGLGHGVRSCRARPPRRPARGPLSRGAVANNRNGRLPVEHHHRQPPGALHRRHQREVRNSDEDGDADVYFRRIQPSRPGKTTGPRWARRSPRISSSRARRSTTSGNIFSARAS